MRNLAVHLAQRGLEAGYVEVQPLQEIVCIMCIMYIDGESMGLTWLRSRLTYRQRRAAPPVHSWSFRTWHGRTGKKCPPQLSRNTLIGVNTCCWPVSSFGYAGNRFGHQKEIVPEEEPQKQVWSAAGTQDPLSLDS